MSIFPQPCWWQSQRLGNTSSFLKGGLGGTRQCPLQEASIKKHQNSLRLLELNSYPIISVSNLYSIFDKVCSHSNFGCREMARALSLFSLPTDTLFQLKFHMKTHLKFPLLVFLDCFLRVPSDSWKKIFTSVIYVKILYKVCQAGLELWSNILRVASRLTQRKWDVHWMVKGFKALTSGMPVNIRYSGVLKKQRTLLYCFPISELNFWKR